jgi:hypothetical protein
MGRETTTILHSIFCIQSIMHACERARRGYEACPRRNVDSLALLKMRRRYVTP